MTVQIYDVASPVLFLNLFQSVRMEQGGEFRRRQKTLVHSAMAARSFSSPQGELEMHRLRRALEKVSFDQTLGGRLEESDGETKPPSRGTLSRRSLTDSSETAQTHSQVWCVLTVPLIGFVSLTFSFWTSDGLLFPASPLDWDNFTDPEYLFTAFHPVDPPPGQCRSQIHGLLGGRPVSWEVTVDLGHLWDFEGQETPGSGGYEGGREEGVKGEETWQELIHQLTARSVIRDFEKMAEKESDNGHGQIFVYCHIKTYYCLLFTNFFCHFDAF